MYKIFFTGIFTPSDDWFTTVQRNYIQDFQLVDQIKWDQAFKRNFNNDNNEQMSSKSYPNYAVSAGGALFVNMITGGIVMILISIYQNHLVIIMAVLKMTEPVRMVIKTHVLELEESVYC